MATIVMPTLVRGTSAARPAAATSVQVYFCTDTVEAFFWDGSAWHMMLIS